MLFILLLYMSLGSQAVVTTRSPACDGQTRGRRNPRSGNFTLFSTETQSIMNRKEDTTTDTQPRITPIESSKPSKYLRTTTPPLSEEKLLPCKYI